MVIHFYYYIVCLICQFFNGKILLSPLLLYTIIYIFYYFSRCQKGTTGDTCNDFPEVCSIITPCINNGTCNDESGTAKCTCSDSMYVLIWK